MNSGPLWLISITDMPLPRQSSISAAACCKTLSGKVAGPELKLMTRDMRGSLKFQAMRSKIRLISKS